MITTCVQVFVFSVVAVALLLMCIAMVCVIVVRMDADGMKDQEGAYEDD